MQKKTQYLALDDRLHYDEFLLYLLAELFLGFSRDFLLVSEIL